MGPGWGTSDAAMRRAPRRGPGAVRGDRRLSFDMLNSWCLSDICPTKSEKLFRLTEHCQKTKFKSKSEDLIGFINS